MIYHNFMRLTTNYLCLIFMAITQANHLSHLSSMHYKIATTAYELDGLKQNKIIKKHGKGVAAALTGHILCKPKDPGSVLGVSS